MRAPLSQNQPEIPKIPSHSQRHSTGMHVVRTGDLVTHTRYSTDNGNGVYVAVTIGRARRNAVQPAQHPLLA